MLSRASAAYACLLPLLAVRGAGAQPTDAARLASRDCATLASATLTDARITSATPVAANADGSSVAHCKALGVIGKEIRFQVLLPDSWNGRFFMEGAGGFAGTLEIGGMRYLGSDTRQHRRTLATTRLRSRRVGRRTIQSA